MSVLELKVPGPVSRAALAAYVDGARPPLATEDDIDAVIAGLAIALPRARNDGAVASAKADIYATALADVPLPDLQAASEFLIKNARFFPTVAEIRAAAAKAGGPRTARIARAGFMILRHDRDWVPPVQADDAVDVTDVMAEALAAHPSKR